MVQEQAQRLVIAQAQRVGAQHALLQKVINLGVRIADGLTLCERHGPTVLAAHADGHKAGVLCAEIALQLFACGHKILPGLGHLHAGFLKHIGPIEHVVGGNFFRHADDLPIHGKFSRQSVVRRGLRVAQVHHIVLEHRIIAGLKIHQVRQLAGRRADLHLVEILSVVLELLDLDVHVGVQLLESALQIHLLIQVHGLVVVGGKGERRFDVWVQRARGGGAGARSGAAGSGSGGGRAARAAAARQQHGGHAHAQSQCQNFFHHDFPPLSCAAAARRPPCRRALCKTYYEHNTKSPRLEMTRSLFY